LHFLVVFEGVRVCEGLVSDFIERIGTVGNQLSQENLFVGVKCVDDQAHQLGDFGLKGEGFDFIFFLHFGGHGCSLFVCGYYLFAYL